MKDPLAPLTCADIANEKLVQGNVETVRRYLRVKILHCHQLGSDQITQYSYRGSVYVRVGASSAAKLADRRVNLEKIGKTLTEVCGNKDEVVVEALNNGEPPTELRDRVAAMVLKKLGLS